MRNLWQEKREILNHTYINHHFIALISRPKFKELLLNKNFEAKEIDDIILNFANVKQKTTELLEWANPYAVNSKSISELSHLHGVELEDSSVVEYFQNREQHYRAIYQDAIAPKIKNTVMALDDVAYYIEEFKKESDSIDEKFIDNFRSNVYILSESLREFKEIEHGHEN